jgi:hypothetical protein
LNQLLRNGENPQLGEFTLEQLGPFEKMRQNLQNPLILALLHSEGGFALDTDASNQQIGSRLLQDQPDGSKQPLSYYIRELTNAEKNYSTTEQECHAIFWAVLQLRPYIDRKRFAIRTDHHDLKWVMSLADVPLRLARWRLRVLEFDFEV